MPKLARKLCFVCSVKLNEQFYFGLGVGFKIQGTRIAWRFFRLATNRRQISNVLQNSIVFLMTPCQVNFYYQRTGLFLFSQNRQTIKSPTSLLYVLCLLFSCFMLVSILKKIFLIKHTTSASIGLCRQINPSNLAKAAFFSEKLTVQITFRIDQKSNISIGKTVHQTN